MVSTDISTYWKILHMQYMNNFLCDELENNTQIISTSYTSDEMISDLREAKMDILHSIHFQKILLKDTKIRDELRENLSKLDSRIDSFLALLKKQSANADSLSLSRIAKEKNLKLLFKMMKAFKQRSLNSQVINVHIKSFLYYPFKYTYCFLMKSANTLEQFDNENAETVNIRLDTIPERLGYISGLCTLKEGLVFYCGGYSSESSVFLDCCYMINPFTQEWMRLEDLPFPRNNIVPLQVEDHIYIFGGYSRGVLTAASRYSLRDNTWVNLRNMPYPSRCVSCVHIDNSILLAGRETEGILKYNTQLDEYEKIFETDRDYCVLFQVDSGDVFFLTKSLVFKSHKNNFLNWEKVGKYSSFLINIENTPQQFGHHVHFTIADNRHFRFNWKSYSLTEHIEYYQ